MRVLIITEDDPIYVIQFFRRFFEVIDTNEIELVGLTISKAFHESIWKTALRMWRFYGPFDFVRLFFRFAKAKLSRASIAKIAEEQSIPVYDTSSVNDAGYLERIGKLQPDVIVSVAAPEIFKRPLLRLAEKACINIHSGCLPKYRGMMPVFWQMKHGESSATVTIHEMVPKLDAGSIFATRQFEIRARDTLDRMISATKRGGAELMAETLLSIKSDSVTPIPLDMKDKEYFSFPKPSDVREFRTRGHKLL